MCRKHDTKARHCRDFDWQAHRRAQHNGLILVIFGNLHTLW
jgi:hypothetical protein